MQHLKTKLISRVIVFVFCFNMLFSQNKENLSPFEYKHFTSIVCLFAGLCFDTRSNDFINEYAKYFSTNVEQFSTSPIVSLAFKFDFIKNIRLGLSLGYVSSGMSDYFKEKFSNYDLQYERDIGENLSITTYPCLFITEYNPIEKQFQGYVGAGAGFVYSQVKWEESVNSNYEDDTRKGGIIKFDKGLFPAFRIYTGVELGFDKKPGDKFLGSLILEADYTFIFRFIDMFSDIAKQFDPKPPGWDNKYAIFPGYIGLSIGLSFNFQRRQKQ